jgi:hypothetical protein
MTTTKAYTESQLANLPGIPTQTGNSGKYLTTDGTNTSWGTISSGGMTLLSTTTLSGSSTTISGISGNYTNLYVYWYGINSSDSGNYWRVIPNGDGGISNSVNMSYPNNTVSGSQNNAMYIWNSNNSYDSRNTNNAGNITINNYSQTNGYKPFTAISYVSSGSANITYVAGTINTTSAITSLLFLFGTYSGGTVKIYGVN